RVPGVDGAHGRLLGAGDGQVLQLDHQAQAVAAMLGVHDRDVLPAVVRDLVGQADRGPGHQPAGRVVDQARVVRAAAAQPQNLVDAPDPGRVDLVRLDLQ